MGTRGLLGHIVRGRKKASYNHFDSFPIGLGLNLVKFIRSLSDEQIEQMRNNLQNIVWVDQHKDRPNNETRSRYLAEGFADLSVSDRSPDNWYCLLRHVQGADAPPRILDGSLSHLIESTDFEQDTLVCEWIYYIDWDEKTVSVKTGEFGPGVEVKTSFVDLTEEWMLAQDKRDEDEEEEG